MCMYIYICIPTGMSIFIFIGVSTFVVYASIRSLACGNLGQADNDRTEP